MSRKLPIVTASRPKGFTSVMAGRLEPPDALDFFCTPPWATRALCKHVLFASGGSFPMPLSAWEPAAGEGHMAEVLMEYFQQVRASDVFDYGCGYEVGSFVGCGPDVATVLSVPDWIITNPPFNLACEFALRAISIARAGVALLVRSAWSEGGDRYRDLFSKHPPALIAQFAERVPMVKGRWNPDASSATAYAWFVWRAPATGETRFMWIPPGQRGALIKQTDRARFAGEAEDTPNSGTGGQHAAWEPAAGEGHARTIWPRQVQKSPR
jgi:hypothetical protein